MISQITDYFIWYLFFSQYTECNFVAFFAISRYVTDFGQIAAMGVMSTPALVIDNKVVSMGKVLSKDDVIKALKKVRG